MREVEKINIKNKGYYFFDDMIDIKIFNSNLLTKSHEDVDIYYIGYFTIKNFSDCENIHSMNSLCLMIHSATGYSKKNKEKILNY